MDPNFFDNFIFQFFYIQYELAILLAALHVVWLYTLTKFTSLDFALTDYILSSICFGLLFLQIALQKLEGSEVTIYLVSNHISYNYYIKLVKASMAVLLIMYLGFARLFCSIIVIPLIEFLVLIFLIFFSLSIIISSNHLFVIFLFLEITNISLYCLIGLNKNSNKGIEAAYKYFVQSALATILGFFAISLLYVQTGTLFLNELGTFFSNLNVLDMSGTLKLSMLLLVVAVFFKLGLFPLHSWLPDVYQGGHLIVTLFIATLPKFAYTYLFVKIFNLCPSLLSSYCLYISLFSIIYGSLITLYQISLKRLLGYGSMVHMGFVVYLLALNTTTSIAASVFYLIIYAILMFFVFCFMFFLFEESEKGLFFIDDVSKLGGILNKNYLLVFFFSYIVLSLAGLPFFVGFISKWYIFTILLMNNKFLDLAILLSCSVLGASYYIRLIRFLFFTDNKNKKVKFNSIPQANNLFYFLIAFLFIFNILIIFYHNWIFLYILKCVMSFFG